MSKASRAYLALSENAIDQIQKLGRDIAVARKRRYISMSEMAERMMVNPKTVQRLEEGDPAVGLTGVSVTWSLPKAIAWPFSKTSVIYRVISENLRTHQTNSIFE
jgi:DNA-binding XRE family transcriptional regulator